MINYSIDYQYLRKCAARPSDDGEVVGIRGTDQSGAAIIPNVGDYVDIAKTTTDGRVDFAGKVRTRLFRYTRLSNDDVHCQVNIVVEETDDDWGKLVKE